MIELDIGCEAAGALIERVSRSPEPALATRESERLRDHLAGCAFCNRDYEEAIDPPVDGLVPVPLELVQIGPPPVPNGGLPLPETREPPPSAHGTGATAERSSPPSAPATVLVHEALTTRGDPPDPGASSRPIASTGHHGASARTAPLFLALMAAGSTFVLGLWIGSHLTGRPDVTAEPRMTEELRASTAQGALYRIGLTNAIATGRIPPPEAFELLADRSQERVPDQVLRAVVRTGTADRIWASREMFGPARAEFFPHGSFYLNITLPSDVETIRVLRDGKPDGEPIWVTDADRRAGRVATVRWVTTGAVFAVTYTQAGLPLSGPNGPRRDEVRVQVAGERATSHAAWTSRPMSSETRTRFVAEGETAQMWLWIRFPAGTEEVRVDDESGAGPTGQGYWLGDDERASGLLVLRRFVRPSVRLRVSYRSGGKLVTSADGSAPLQDVVDAEVRRPE